MGPKYFLSPGDEKPLGKKEPVKEIVIACNTATAYGLETVKNAILEWGIPLKVTGIIEAGATAAINVLKERNIAEPLIVVFATEGTCASGGYPNTIYTIAGDSIPGLNPEVLQQAGIGLAGAIDGDINYLDPEAKSIRGHENYFGPDIDNKDYKLDIKLWNDYNFSTGNELFIRTNLHGDTISVQLNSVRNYVNYMVTSLVDKVHKQSAEKSIDLVILGCTHYTYVEQEIRKHFSFLKSRPGYIKNIPDSIVIIDPSESLAISLYKSLYQSKLLGNNPQDRSGFYISVPNTLLGENIINDDLEFPYEWKYGREVNSGMQYVKNVPFSELWIDEDIRSRIKATLPYTWSLIK
jgi:glutamate racemase